MTEAQSPAPTWFARAAGACQRDQASGGKKGADLIDFFFAADEAG